MSRIEMMAHDWHHEELKQRPLQPFEDFYKATRAFQAGYRAALEDAAIRGRLAQLEDKVVDIEILALADWEDA